MRVTVEISKDKRMFQSERTEGDPERYGSLDEVDEYIIWTLGEGIKMVRKLIDERKDEANRKAKEAREKG